MVSVLTQPSQIQFTTHLLRQSEPCLEVYLWHYLEYLASGTINTVGVYNLGTLRKPMRAFIDFLLCNDITAHVK